MGLVELMTRWKEETWKPLLAWFGMEGEHDSIHSLKKKVNGLFEKVQSVTLGWWMH